MKTSTGGRVVFIAFGTLCILGGAYTLRETGEGWSTILVGLAIISYVAITGKF